MRHVAAESLITVAPASVIAFLVLCLGSVMARPLASQGDGPQQDAQRCVEAPFRTMAESSVDGVARLCTDELPGVFGGRPTFASSSVTRSYNRTIRSIRASLSSASSSSRSIRPANSP